MSVVLITTNSLQTLLELYFPIKVSGKQKGGSKKPENYWKSYSGTKLEHFLIRQLHTTADVAFCQFLNSIASGELFFSHALKDIISPRRSLSNMLSP